MRQQLLIMKIALLLPLLLALTTTIIPWSDAAALRLRAIHADAGRGLTSQELLRRMSARSLTRATRLLSGGAGAAVLDPGYSNGIPDTEYLVHLDVGTPPQPVQLTLDTGSDLVWTQCMPCDTCFDQALPYFDPSSSSTFSLVPCHQPMCDDMPSSSCSNETCVYMYSYADKSITAGHLDVDTFTFAASSGTDAVSVSGLAFGCGVNNSGIFKSNETGIAGFGRGALSLPSQLKVDNFSHCFTDIMGSETSHVLLGIPANLYNNAGGVVQSTPLIQNAKNLTPYYLSLKGITVGSMRLQVPESVFALKQDGTGGTIINSGTGMTSLPKDVYKLVLDAFIAQATLPVYNSLSVSQLCFSAPAGAKPDVPELVLHFDGATLDLPWENYMFEVEEAGITCLAVNAGGDVTIIGNYQQQNMHVLYDLANSVLSFVPAQCNKL